MSAFELLEEEPLVKEKENLENENSVFSFFENEVEDPLAATLSPSEESFTSPININEQEENFNKFRNQLEAKEKAEKEYNNRSYLGKLWQNVAGLGARAGEAALGIPADIENFGEFMLVDLPEHVESYLSGKEYRLPDKYRKLITGIPLKRGEEGYEEYKKAKGFSLPSSEDIREGITKPLTGEYLEPKSKQQERDQETVQDIIRFIMPGTSANRFTRLSPASKVAIPIYANIGKDIAESLGFSTTTQEAIKMGLTLGLDLHGRGRTRDYAASLINRAEQRVRPGQMMDTRYIEHRLAQVERNLQRGGPSPSTNRALQAIQDFRNRIQNNQIEVSDAMAFRRRLNDVLSSGGGFDVPGASKPAWTRNIQRVKNRIISGVERELRHSNPEAARLWREGNQAFSVFAQSSRMGDWIRRQTKRPFISNSMKFLFPAAGYMAGETAIKYLPQTLTAAAPIYGGIKSYQIINRAIRSPTIRRYYRQVMRAAIRENALNYAKYSEKLDKALRIYEAKDPILKDLMENQ